ncbi:MAG TPA: FAD-dependent oxidoreductase [Solirubrobacterales bacterium]|nr:FAD-dependent oxidoreductase [Solirubrobacterales bacterium]
MTEPAETDRARLETDVAVVGGGAAGLYVALRAAEHGAQVTVVSRKPLAESASYWAQGGLAAALAPDDSPARHAQDTLNAGRGLCRSAAVEVLTREAPAAVAELRERGVRFDVESEVADGGEGGNAAGGLSLALEGGHSARRIVHAGGAQTGRAITGRLAELVGANERVRVLEETSALALWSDGSACAGVLTDAGAIEARATVLATGGGAALWERTTNPWGAIGAGAVLAHAAGATLADLEFCQFHPTALALPGSEHDGTLLTEALRGEGAELLDASGRRFTDELAPRDQVTAAILDRIDADGSDHVVLDLRSISPERFANVFAACRAAGLDAEADPVPVAPAAHYLMGGVVCDLDGATTLPGLYAVGECACSGVHGANRLASNSLSECFVFGARAAAAAASAPEHDDRPTPPAWRFQPPTAATRESVWRHAGPRRDAGALEPLLDDPYPLARLIARAALERRESRGPHQRSDHPMQDPALDGVHIPIDPDESLRTEHWP